MVDEMYRVFLVDDEEITLTQTAETIPWLDNGFSVIGMESDPVRAFERIMQEKPEVVFCDLKMPKMDGNELISKILKEGLRPEFVMLSAYGGFDDVRKFFKQEGFDYLLKPVRMAEVEFLLENLARRLARKYPVATTDATDDFEQNGNENFKAMVGYIRENFTEHYTLERLSRQFNLSNSYICALFAKYFNTSLTGFITRLRMDEIGKRIRESSEPFKSIASACGYKDYYYFSKVFKDYYGVSPTEYRESENQGNTYM